MSLAFDGNGDAVLVTSSSSIEISDNLSYSVWLKCGSQGVDDNIAVKWDTLGSFILSVESNNNRRLRIIVSDDGSYDVAHTKDWWTTNDVLTASGWAHVVFTFASGSLKLYVNGTEITAFTKNFDPNITSLYTGNEVLKISTANANAWTGEMVNISIWDTAVLSQADITALYNSGVPIDPRNLRGSSANLASAWLWNRNIVYPTIKDNIKY